MQLKFSGAPEIAATREHLWHRLTDPNAVAACAPGVETVEALGPTRFKVISGFGVGTIRLKFTMDVELNDVVDYNSMTIRARGKAPGSAVDVQSAVSLESIEPMLTRLVWNADTEISGTVASVGGRLIESTSKKLIEQFWTRFAAEVAATQALEPALPPPARLYPADLAGMVADRLVGAVLLATVKLEAMTLSKGKQLDGAEADALVGAARASALMHPVKLAWLGPDDLHEDAASLRLARAVAGSGVRIGDPRQSRVDLVADADGVLRIDAGVLEAINRIDPLEVFTLYDGEAVNAGQVVASTKVAPHIVPAAAVAQGEQVAAAGSAVRIQPYVPTVVGAIVAEELGADALERFGAAVRMKVEALGSTFAGFREIHALDPKDEEARARGALDEFVLSRGAAVVVVGGVSAGDPLAPFYAALESLGGRIVRRGVPAHPGSMIWLAELGSAQILGIPQCGTFSQATAADLVLPRLLTGERLSAEAVAGMGHGGLLTRDMRFRFPAYARERELGAPEAAGPQ